MSLLRAAAAALLCAGLCLMAASAHRHRAADLAPDLATIQPADVLFFGDSQNLGYFGAQLYRSISAETDPKTGRALGVWGYWVCGSDVDDWLTGSKTYCGMRVCAPPADRCIEDYGPQDHADDVRYPAITAYAARVHPRVTLIVLGSNLLTWKMGEFRGAYDSYMASAGRMADAIAKGGSQCIWIGPPQIALHAKPIEVYERYVADLRRAVTAHGCAFIDSNPLSDRKFLLRSDPEGIHYDGTGERAWEHGVWAALRPLLQARLAH
ncbi:MAG TPA: hypothetical protein VHZ78_04250 [Rhizomicrobium sp.]|jgi:hypothetical protein|nr:hypothetical protein [Rhizomicrobium sp.]